MNKVITPSEHGDIEYIKFTSHLLYINDDFEAYIPFNKKSHILRGENIVSKLKRVLFTFSVEDAFIMDCCCNISTQFYCLYQRNYNNVEIKFKDGTIIKDVPDMPLVANEILMNLIGKLANKK